jgi:acyl-CoA synthetase (AMP-forming)/AMP-acid ligase II
MVGRGTATAVLAAGKGIHLGALTAVLAERYGARIAVEEDSGTPGLPHRHVRTVAEVEDAVARLAAAHRAAGRGEGQRVLVLVANRFDVVLHALALARLGAVAVPVNARLRPAEVAAIAASAGAVAVLADDAVADALAAAPAADDGLPALDWSRTGTDGPGGTLAGWLQAHPDERVAADHQRDPSETALLLATSGTTGTPKAAALSSRGLLAAMGRLVAAPLGRRQGPRADRDLVLAALPLTHIMGFSVALGALCAGVPLLHRERFDAGEALDLIEDRRPNAFIGVPTMYADLETAGAEDRDLSSIQLFASAADAMPTARARRFQHLGAAARIGGRPIGNATFVDVYGMVELSGAAAVRVMPPSPVTRVDLPALAVVLPGIDVRTVDEHGRPVRRGDEGELQFRGETVLSAYEGRPDAGPDAEGWFATGDHARLYPGGVFRFAGRSRDRIKVGGFSVFPAEVETDLRAHEGVREVAMVGVPDDRLGERPVALVVPRGAGFDEAAYLAWTRDTVAGYRRPTAVVVVDDLPRGAHGKLDRQGATALAVQHLEDHP